MMTVDSCLSQNGPITELFCDDEHFAELADMCKKKNKQIPNDTTKWLKRRELEVGVL